MNAEIADFAAACQELIDEQAQVLRDMAEHGPNKGTSWGAALIDRANDMTLIANAISRAGSIHRG